MEPSNVGNISCELVFVFIGDKLPNYARDSIRIAAETNGLPIIVLGNRKLANSVPLNFCKFIEIESFYNPNVFSSAARSISSDHRFRGGFWLKSLERFFVLSSYMHNFNVKGLLHAELDQLLFRVDILAENLEESGLKGVFVPLHSNQAAVASIFYCNDVSALDSLLDFPSQGKTFPNEMALIAQWVDENPEMAFPLPTLASELNRNLVSSDHLAKSIPGGLVDAAQLGQWVAGIDPKNVPINQKPVNKFVDPQSGWLLSKDQLESVRFSYLENEKKLTCSYKEHVFYIFNLHLHSKIHSSLIKKLTIKDLTTISNLSVSSKFPGTRITQINHYLGSRLLTVIRDPHRIFPELMKRFYRSINMRPTSSPFLSGDSFRHFSNHVWEAQSKTLRPEQIRVGDVIFCESDSFKECRDSLLSFVSVPYTLILGNSDENHFKNFREELAGLSFTEIFAQNLHDEVEGITPLPIGLENRWRANHGKISKFGKMNLDVESKTFRIMSTFSIGTNPAVRGKAQEILGKNPLVDSLGMISPKQHREALAQYAFIACPPGNGLDTHRTWEAMYRGSIPIVLDSFMNRYFQSLGLPIFIVETYEELSSLRENDLKTIFIANKHKFESDALWLPYWKAQILKTSL